ncbi:MAG: phasin family protein [Anaerolineales bacterium]|nr:phasin family protein [Anaerolineales bacterium]
MTQEIAQELEQQVNGASEAGAEAVAADTVVEDVAEIDVDIDILEEESLDASNPLLDSLRRVLMAGIGMVALAQEEIEDFVNRLIDRGEIAEQDGRSLINDILENRKQALENRRQAVVETTKKASDRASSEVDQRIEGILHRLNIPTVSEIDQLSNQIDALSKKIDELNANGA